MQKKEYLITLADRKWTITSPVKFKQLQIIEPAITLIRNTRMTGMETIDQKFYDAMANVVLAAVMPQDPSFTRAALDELEFSGEELSNAVKNIARAAVIWQDPDADIRKEAEALTLLSKHATMTPEEFTNLVEAALNAQYSRGKAEGPTGEASPAANPPAAKAG